MTAGAIVGLLDVEKNPDVSELLRLHLEVALRECSHPNKHWVGINDGEHANVGTWCPDCRAWI